MEYLEAPPIVPFIRSLAQSACRLRSLRGELLQGWCTVRGSAARRTCDASVRPDAAAPDLPGTLSRPLPLLEFMVPRRRSGSERGVAVRGRETEALPAAGKAAVSPIGG